MSDIAVKLENISKFYKLYDEPKDRLKEALHPLKKKYHRKFFALNNINLEVKKGEILGIVGRNGSGKSTLLSIISGVIQPSSGNVTVNGDISALLELGSGMDPDFTGIQNIYFSGTMMGFNRKEMEKKIDSIVDFADIGDFIHQPLKTYSSGMKSRLGFALAINMDPDILILDEVLAVGDDLFKRKCYAKMEEFFKGGSTVLYVSHSLNSINELCSKAIFLDQGEKILEGPPKLITAHYQKYLFAEPNDRNIIRTEILQVNKDIKRKKDFAASEEEIQRSEEEKKTRQKIEEPKQESFFIPNFKPKSTLVSKNYDVEIEDIHLETLDGKRVNALVLGEEYVYLCKVSFNVPAENVVFSMAIKNEKGMIVSSVKSGIGLKNYGDVVGFAAKGDRFLVNIKFRCNLLPGNYYTNSAVKSFPNGKEPFVLNRVVDSAVFKVQEVPHLMHGGFCHLNQDVEVTRFKF
jgi:lipopolysaccharide transport system ATP-binding protein